MKKFLFFAAVAVALAACQKNPGPEPGPDPEPLPSSPEQVWVLHNGTWGGSDSEIMIYDRESGNVLTSAFQTVNGKRLGDTANDMIACGELVAIAATGSKCVWIVYKNVTEVAQIVVTGADGTALSPRRLAYDGSYVYITLQEGVLARASAATGWQAETLEVGPAPEGLLYDNGLLYVVNSDEYSSPMGMNASISIVDAAQFKVVKTVPCNCNAQQLYRVSEDKFYLMSWGNYADIPAALTVFNPKTYTLTDVAGVAPTFFAVGTGNKAYYASREYDAAWNPTITYCNFDTSADRRIGELVPASEVKPDINAIGLDPETSNVWMGCSDYMSNGSIIVFSPEGQEQMRIKDTGAVNPQAFLFL